MLYFWQLLIIVKLMNKKQETIELEDIVIKFAGDSGDGMQLTGTQFSDTSAFIGNDLSTFPDYPSEEQAILKGMNYNLFV